MLEQIQGFQKLCNGIFHSICLMPFQPQPQNVNKKVKNFASTLAMVNYDDWVEASPPLSYCF